MEKEIIYYYTSENKCPYKQWRDSLNLSIRVRVNKRVARLRDGIYGDFKPLQNSELSELRMDFGAGYRIYYKDLGDTVILFLAGSDKKDQKRTIEKANEYYEDFKQRKA